MIIDAHCHVWENWPYQPPVPDPQSRARVEQLLYEMDANEVERAVIICARLGDNPGNVDYALSAVARYPERLIAFPDLECRWSMDYRRPGALGRLDEALGRWDFGGFTLYLDEQDEGDWLLSDEGRAFFARASERELILSLSIVPHQAPAAVALAAAFPSLPILLHHFAFLGPRSAGTPDAMELVLAAAARPNIFLKFSGMGNVAAVSQEFPYPELQDMPRRLAAAFGASRMVWGSDYPVSRRHMTYRQSLSLLTRHGPFAGAELAQVLGGNMARLLAERRP
ncbi:MAG TPA: amidohydrolase family protein [Devosia sp.]|nr:amidohydrolase family protein [Devosia sp.]